MIYYRYLILRHDKLHFYPAVVGVAAAGVRKNVRSEHLVGRKMNMMVYNVPLERMMRLTITPAYCGIPTERKHFVILSYPPNAPTEQK